MKLHYNDGSSFCSITIVLCLEKTTTIYYIHPPLQFVLFPYKVRIWFTYSHFLRRFLHIIAICIVHITTDSTAHSMHLNSLEYCIFSTSMTNIRPGWDVNAVHRSLGPQPDRMSHLGRLVITPPILGKDNL